MNSPFGRMGSQHHSHANIAEIDENLPHPSPPRSESEKTPVHEARLGPIHGEADMIVI